MMKYSNESTLVAASKTTPIAQRCEANRLEKLFELYTKMTTQQAPSQKSAKGKTKGAKR